MVPGFDATTVSGATRNLNIKGEVQIRPEDHEDLKIFMTSIKLTANSSTEARFAANASVIKMLADQVLCSNEER